MKSLLSKRNFFVIFFLIFGLSIFLQCVGLFNADSSWLTVCTLKFLHGGKYYTDFFETNPPMILYLCIPPVVASQFFHISIIITYTVYIFLLAIFSLIVCERFLKKIFYPQEKFFYQILMLALAFVYLLIPGYSFGQREHIALMFVMPYLLLVGARLEHVGIRKCLIIVAGIMAGVGFAIKPQFLIPLVFVEIYLIFKNKSFFYWIRTESLIILSILVLYLISIFIITPEYIYKILPLVLPLYTLSVADSWGQVFGQITVGFSVVVLGFYFFRKNTLRYLSIAKILLISSAGFFVAYLLQRVAWYYHEIPFFGLMIIFVFFIFSDLWTSVETKSEILWNKIQGGLIILVAIIFIVPIILKNIGEAEAFKVNVLPLFEKTIDIYGGRSVYFLAMGSHAYPLINYAHVQSVSRFPYFLILPQLIRNLQAHLSVAEQEKTIQQKKEFIQMVTEDLAKNPTLVFVRKSIEYDNGVTDDQEKTGPIDFDYIQFFSKNLSFNKLFQNYKKVGSVLIFDVYQLKSAAGGS